MNMQITGTLVVCYGESITRVPATLDAFNKFMKQVGALSVKSVQRSVTINGIDKVSDITISDHVRAIYFELDGNFDVEYQEETGNLKINYGSTSVNILVSETMYNQVLQARKVVQDVYGEDANGNIFYICIGEEVRSITFDTSGGEILL